MKIIRKSMTAMILMLIFTAFPTYAEALRELESAGNNLVFAETEDNCYLKEIQMDGDTVFLTTGTDDNPVPLWKVVFMIREIGGSKSVVHKESFPRVLVFRLSPLHPHPRRHPIQATMCTVQNGSMMTAQA
jgi:hypothetical protein